MIAALALSYIFWRLGCKDEEEEEEELQETNTTLESADEEQAVETNLPTLPKIELKNSVAEVVVEDISDSDALLQAKMWNALVRRGSNQSRHESKPDYKIHLQPSEVASSQLTEPK